MADWRRVATGTSAWGNIAMNIDIGIASVTRTSNTNVRVVYGIRFQPAQWTYNAVCAWCPAGGTRYYAFNSYSGAYHTNTGTWYYANGGDGTTAETCPFTTDITVGITQTSATLSIGVDWRMYNPGSAAGTVATTITFPTGATKPTGLWCSATAVNETSFNLSGGYGSDGNATVTATGFQYRKDGTSTWYTTNANPSGLEPGQKYYFKYYATNSQGTAESDGNANATSYSYPHVTNAPNFTIGTKFGISLYNPLGRYCIVDILNSSEQSMTSYGARGSYFGDGWMSQAEMTAYYNNIPNSKSGIYKIRFRCTEVGVDEIVNGATYKIKDDGTEIPNFSDSNWSYVANLITLTNNNQVVIKGYSTISFTVNQPATSSFGASISKYVYKWGNQSVDSTSANYVSNGDTNILEVDAVDSRGLIKPTTKTLESGTTYIPYNSPTLDYSNCYTHRTDGISNETKLTLRGNLSVVKFGSSGINNVIYSAKYKVYDYDTNTWSNEYNIPTNNFNLNQNGVFTLNDFLIHANGSSGGFIVGKRYAIQVIIKDGNGILGTLTSNNILITDGKIARDVYQDGNGDYHQGINGLANEDYTETIHGKENITDSLYINGIKAIWYE